MNETTVRTLLRRIASEAPAPTPADVERVIASSKACRRRRAWAEAASAAAVVLAVALSAAGLAAGVHAPPDDRVVPQAAVEHALPATAPARFDVPRSRLTVAGIPGDLTVRRTSVRGEELSVSADSADSADRADGADSADASVSVRVGAKGYDLPAYSVFVTADSAFATTGPVIGGSPSQWHDDGHGRYSLLWQWAPDAWALVTVEYPRNPLALAVRLAHGIALDLDARTTPPSTPR